MSHYIRDAQTQPVPVVIASPPSPQHPLPSRPPRKRRRWPWLAAIGILVVFGVSLLVYALGAPSTAATPTSAANPTAKSTHAPTLASSVKATSQPTARASTVPTTHSTQQPAPSSGPAIIGGELGAFVATYGQPNNHSIASSGLYHFKRYPNSTLDLLIARTDLTDAGVYTSRVEEITVQAPDAGWSQQDATAACAAFLPGDAVYKREVKLATGYDKLYVSATLASLFPASSFVDVNGQQVQAGSFDVQYLYRSGTIVASCDILIGTQQTQL